MLKLLEDQEVRNHNMTKHLTDIKIPLPTERLKRDIADNPKNTESNEVFQKAYQKHLLKKTLESLSVDMVTTDIGEELLEAVKSKMEFLDDPKFNIKIVKQLKEEIDSQ